MEKKFLQVRLHIIGVSEADEEDLAVLTQRLCNELSELDLDSVKIASAGEVPAGAKAGDPFTWGQLLLTLAASGGVLTTLINVLQSWVCRQERCRLTMEIGEDKLEIQGISSQEEQRLIEAWIRHHQTR